MQSFSSCCDCDWLLEMRLKGLLVRFWEYTALASIADTENLLFFKHCESFVYHNSIIARCGRR